MKPISASLPAHAVTTCCLAAGTRLHDGHEVAVAENDVHDARGEEQREVGAEGRQQPGRRVQHLVPRCINPLCTECTVRPFSLATELEPTERQPELKAKVH